MMYQLFRKTDSMSACYTQRCGSIDSPTCFSEQEHDGLEDKTHHNGDGISVSSGDSLSIIESEKPRYEDSESYISIMSYSQVDLRESVGTVTSAVGSNKTTEEDINEEDDSESEQQTMSSSSDSETSIGSRKINEELDTEKEVHDRIGKFVEFDPRTSMSAFSPRTWSTRSTTSFSSASLSERQDEIETLQEQVKARLLHLAEDVGEHSRHLRKELQSLRTSLSPNSRNPEPPLTEPRPLEKRKTWAEF